MDRKIYSIDKICVIGKLASLLTIFLATLSSSPSWSDLPIGTNLGGISYWTTQRPFTNLFKQSRTWFTQCAPEDQTCDNSWDTRESDKLEIDDKGWVKSIPQPSEPGFSIVSTLLHLPEGKYVVSYQGEGDIRYGLSGKLVEKDLENGRDLVEIAKPNGKLLLQIYATDPNKNGNYIRDIKIISSEHADRESTQTFRESFLNHVRPYKAIRFMDWMATNGNDSVNWEQRLKPDYATYSHQTRDKLGVPPEVMVELANELDKHVWFTMPHQANDDYIRNFAELVRGQISTSKTIYVEYSNEVWNSTFPQFSWAVSQGKETWPASSAADLEKAANWYAKRSSEICTIWKTAFQEQPKKIACVIASQAANIWLTEQILACPLWEDSPAPTCAENNFDALAIAPYFGGRIGRQNALELQDWTSLEAPLTPLFQQLQDTSIAHAISRVSEHKQLAKKFGLDLVAYEAGQHLVGTRGLENNDAVTALFINANRDPRMKDLYIRYYRSWFNAGGDLAMNFTLMGEHSKWGSWGSLEGEDQINSPKHSALMELLLE